MGWFDYTPPFASIVVSDTCPCGADFNAQGPLSSSTHYTWLQEHRACRAVARAALERKEKKDKR